MITPFYKKKIILLIIKKINILLNKIILLLKKYLIIILGALLVLFIIWLRYIRARLPKDIPFELTLYFLFILICICLTYLYTIKILIKPKTSNRIIKQIMTYFNKPISDIVTTLSTFDFAMKNNSLTKKYYKKTVEYLIPRIVEFGTMKRVLLIYRFVLFPGYILLSILIVDIFWLHHIEIFYFFIFLNILPLLYVYYKYSLKVVKEEYFMYLESRYDYVKIQEENSIYVSHWTMKNPNAIYHDKYVSIREYFDIQLQQLNIQYLEYEEDDPTTKEIIYKGYPSSKQKFYDEYKIQHNKINEKLNYEDFEILEQDFHNIEPRLLRLIEYIDLTDNFLRNITLLFYKQKLCMIEKEQAVFDSNLNKFTGDQKKARINTLEKSKQKFLEQKGIDKYRSSLSQESRQLLEASKEFKAIEETTVHLKAIEPNVNDTNGYE